jgi:hypothetical protein
MLNRAKGPGSPTDSVTSNTQGSELGLLYIAHSHKDVLGTIGLSRQDADADSGEGYQEFVGRSVTRGSAVLTWMCVEAGLSRCLLG